MALSIERTGASSGVTLDLRFAAPPKAEVSFIYAGLPQHLNLLANGSMADTVKHSRQRLAANLGHIDWQAIEEESVKFFKIKGAALAAKFAAKRFLLDEETFKAEIQKIKLHHNALTAAVSAASL